MAKYMLIMRGTDETVATMMETPFDEMLATGAVVVGRRTFDIARHWNGDHHGGVPIFVPTRGEPPEPASGIRTRRPPTSRAGRVRPACGVRRSSWVARLRGDIRAPSSCDRSR